MVPYGPPRSRLAHANIQVLGHSSSNTSTNRRYGAVKLGVPIIFLLITFYDFGLYKKLYELSISLSPADTTITTTSMITRIIVVAPTFYPNEQDIRVETALELCREAARNQLELILVDASPTESIRQKLVEAGKSSTKDGKEFVRVIRQTYPGKKGGALREGIAAAHQTLLSAGAAANNDGAVQGMIAFQEPEKVNMMAHWRPVAETMSNQQADICVPKRSDASFQQSYPIEQYHSEQFANLYLNSLSKNVVGFPPEGIDWTMGPIAFRSKLANIWLDYPGESYDMQLVPMVRAVRWHSAKVVSYEFGYYQPDLMKAQEQGVPEWSEKRLYQLNFLFDFVAGALKEAKEGEYAAGQKKY